MSLITSPSGDLHTLGGALMTDAGGTDCCCGDGGPNTLPGLCAAVCPSPCQTTKILLIEGVQLQYVGNGQICTINQNWVLSFPPNQACQVAADLIGHPACLIAPNFTIDMVAGLGTLCNDVPPDSHTWFVQMQLFGFGGIIRYVYAGSDLCGYGGYVLDQCTDSQFITVLSCGSASIL